MSFKLRCSLRSQADQMVAAIGMGRARSAHFQLNTHNSTLKTDEYVAARAAVEQADLLEELIEKYTAARKKAEIEADRMR